MTPFIILSALLFTSEGMRDDLAVRRPLETDLKMMTGKWVLKNPPAGWDRVEIEFVVVGKRLTVRFESRNAWAHCTNLLEVISIRENQARRVLDAGSLAVEYELGQGKVRLWQLKPLHGLARVANGGNALWTPTFDGTWVRDK
jgi:hypothetical protein